MSRRPRPLVPYSPAHTARPPILMLSTESPLSADDVRAIREQFAAAIRPPSAAERYTQDVADAERLLEAQWQRGNTAAAHLRNLLFGASYLETDQLAALLSEAVHDTARGVS